MLVIKNTNVIPMTQESVLKNQTVIIENGKIKSINNFNESINYANAQIIDGTDKYIMPGLFDMHVHLNTSELMDLLFANGVTSIRNMWGFPIQLEWKEKIKKGEKIGPYIYTTGPLTDGVMYWEGSYIVTTPEEAEKAVDECMELGYDYFKTYPSIPREAFIRLMEYAKEKGLKVVGHLPANVSVDEMISLGYYSLEHSNQLPDNNDEIIKIAKSGMWLCPTQAVVKTIYDFVYHSHLNKDMTKIPYYEYVNPIDQKEWAEITEWRRAKPKYQDPKKDIEDDNNKVRLFMKYSDKILLGADTPNPGVIAGFSIHDELESMVNDFGMTAYESIKTGTVNAALCLGIEDQKGKLKEGMDSDILILDSNPLEDITNSRKIFGVVQGDRFFDRNSLNNILENVKNLKTEDIIKVY